VSCPNYDRVVAIQPRAPFRRLLSHYVR
jgi:hypothetical protein